MTFQQLSFVVEVANCESINKAAERLYTSQSNVSNSIKALEEELGIQIFLRTKKGVSVTEEGRDAHHKALAADFRRPRRLYLYQAEKTVFLRCSG